MLVARRLLPLFALPALFIGSACSQGEVTAIPLAPRDWAASDYKLEATASADAVQAGDAVTFRATVKLRVPSSPRMPSLFQLAFES